jgi:hypothetical protein
MDQVLDGLWIGSLVSANDSHLLESVGITTVISIGCAPTLSETVENLCFPDILDSPESIILHILTQTNNFLSENIGKGGKCLVHCVYGQSRSATVCVAYMISIGRSLIDAIMELKLRHPNICINPGFLSQLYVYTDPKYSVECEIVKSTAIRLASGTIAIPLADEEIKAQLVGDASCRHCKAFLSHGFKFITSYSENSDCMKIFLDTHVDGFWKGYLPLHTPSPLGHELDSQYFLQPSAWMIRQVESAVQTGAEEGGDNCGWRRCVPVEGGDLVCPGCKRTCGYWKFNAISLCSGYVVCDAYALLGSAISMNGIEVLEMLPAGQKRQQRSKKRKKTITEIVIK